MADAAAVVDPVVSGRRTAGCGGWGLQAEPSRGLAPRGTVLCRASLAFILHRACCCVHGMHRARPLACRGQGHLPPPPAHAQP